MIQGYLRHIPQLRDIGLSGCAKFCHSGVEKQSVCRCSGVVESVRALQLLFEVQGCIMLIGFRAEGSSALSRAWFTV